MSHGLFDQQAGSVLSPAAGQGGWWFDNQTGLLLFKDASNVAYGRTTNASVASQGPGFAVDTYLTNSDLKIPSTLVRAGTRFRWLISLSKTAASTAIPAWAVRVGANRTTADTAAVTINTFAQTAVADVAVVEILVTMRTITTWQATCSMKHNAAAAGFANNDAGVTETTGSVASSAGQFVGISVNGGASSSWTVTQVLAEADW